MHNRISVSAIQKDLEGFLDKVCDGHESLLITRRGRENAILLSERDYRSLKETAYIAGSAENVKRLNAALGRRGGKSLEDVRKELRI